MITQNLQKQPHAEVVAGFHASVYHLLYGFIERINSRRENKLRRELYNYYRKLTIDQLRDIGLTNPQDQLRTLGSYLEAESFSCCEFQTRNFTRWHP